jgi:hypothetical protein
MLLVAVVAGLVDSGGTLVESAFTLLVNIRVEFRGSAKQRRAGLITAA